MRRRRARLVGGFSPGGRTRPTRRRRGGDRSRLLHERAKRPRRERGDVAPRPRGRDDSTRDDANELRRSRGFTRRVLRLCRGRRGNTSANTLGTLSLGTLSLGTLSLGTRYLSTLRGSARVDGGGVGEGAGDAGGCEGCIRRGASSALGFPDRPRRRGWTRARNTRTSRHLEPPRRRRGESRRGYPRPGRGCAVRRRSDGARRRAIKRSPMRERRFRIRA